jgi:hypothetical protein
MEVVGMAIWSVLQPFGIFCGHLEHFMVIWYIFPRFGMLHQEKSGNPGVQIIFIFFLFHCLSGPQKQMCSFL